MFLNTYTASELYFALTSHNIGHADVDKLITDCQTYGEGWFDYSIRNQYNTLHCREYKKYCHFGMDVRETKKECIHLIKKENAFSFQQEIKYIITPEKINSNQIFDTYKNTISQNYEQLKQLSAPQICENYSLKHPDNLNKVQDITLTEIYLFKNENQFDEKDGYFDNTIVKSIKKHNSIITQICSDLNQRFISEYPVVKSNTHSIQFKAFLSQSDKFDIEICAEVHFYFS